MIIRTTHAHTVVILFRILANAAALHIRIRQYQADQETHQTLATYPVPDDLAIEYAEKRQFFEVCTFIRTFNPVSYCKFNFQIRYSKKGELESIMDNLVCKYQETPLSVLECFYFPGDAEDVANYGQALIDWTSDIRKHLIQLKAETAKILRDKEKDSQIPKDRLLSDFLTYEQRLKNIYHSVVKFEHCLKIKYKPAPLPLSNPRQDLVPSSPSAAQVIPDTGRISRPKPNDGIALTERLDKVSLKHQRPLLS